MISKIKNLLKKNLVDSSHPSSRLSSMSVETLEERMMLSTVTIFAAGSTGAEDMKLVVNDQVVKTFKNIGGDADARQFEEITWELDEQVNANQVKVRFSNDLYDPANGIDRNLTVDKIVIDGNTYQTESSQVFSTGTWTSGTGVVPGFGRGETLHANGYFHYGGANQNGTQLSVSARGQGGDANFDILVDGQVVGSFVADTDGAVIDYFHPDAITADQVRIAFTNDQYDPSNGIDVNLIVDSLGINNTNISPSDSTVFSTGTWTPADGVVPGFGRGSTLHANGYFQFASFESSAKSLQLIDEIGDATLLIEVDNASGKYATLTSSGVNSSGDVIQLFNADGSVATEFGDNGSASLRALTNLDPGNDFIISDMAFYPDGSLLLVGRNFNFVGVSVPYILKLNSDGAIDSSFNNGFFTNTLLGIANNDFGNFRVVIDSSGNATVIGNVFNSRNDSVLLRLTANGQVDTSWGFGGTLRITGNGDGNFPDSDLFGAEVLSDGSILVGLSHANALQFPPSLVAKVDPNGFLDQSYGFNGVANIDSVIRFYSFQNLDVDSQGRALLGHSQEIVRLDFNGNLDQSFNQTGRLNFSDGQTVEDGLEKFQGIDGFVVDNQDRLVLSSNIRTATGRFSFNYDGTTIVRIETDGRFDTNFDDEGIQVIDFNTPEVSENNSQIAIDNNGNLLVTIGATGPNSDPATTDRSLARFSFDGGE